MKILGYTEIIEEAMKLSDMQDYCFVMGLATEDQFKSSKRLLLRRIIGLSYLSGDSEYLSKINILENALAALESTMQVDEDIRLELSAKEVLAQIDKEIDATDCMKIPNENAFKSVMYRSLLRAKYSLNVSLFNEIGKDCIDIEKDIKELVEIIELLSSKAGIKLGTDKANEFFSK